MVLCINVYYHMYVEAKCFYRNLAEECELLFWFKAKSKWKKAIEIMCHKDYEILLNITKKCAKSLSRSISLTFATLYTLYCTQVFTKAGKSYSYSKNVYWEKHFWHFVTMLKFRFVWTFQKMLIILIEILIQIKN